MMKIGGFDNNSEVGLYFMYDGKITEIEFFLKRLVFSILFHADCPSLEL